MATEKLCLSPTKVRRAHEAIHFLSLGGAGPSGLNMSSTTKRSVKLDDIATHNEIFLELGEAAQMIFGACAIVSGSFWLKVGNSLLGSWVKASSNICSYTLRNGTVQKVLFLSQLLLKLLLTRQQAFLQLLTRH